MKLNLWSRPQREAVHETVRAHCNANDLHLVALVISSHSKTQRGTSPVFETALDSTERLDIPPETHADEDAWRTSVLDEVTEPVIMACDYKTLLAEASGRVIVLTDFAERLCSGLHPSGQGLIPFEIGPPPEFLSLMSRTAAAESLAEMLESEGIRVSSIHYGPLASCSTGLSPERHSTDRNVEAFVGSLTPSKKGRIHKNKHFSRPFGTCAGIQLSNVV